MTNTIRIVAALLALFAAGVSHAQTAPPNYPARQVRVIVAYPPGGPTDVIARLVAQKLSEQLGQQFYVENLPGAGGAIGAGIAANAPPDGHTLSSPQTILPSAQPPASSATTRSSISRRSASWRPPRRW